MRRGFTLIELLVVIAILGFSTVVGLRWFKSLSRIKLRETVSSFKAFIRYAQFLSLESSTEAEVIIDAGCEIKVLIAGGVLKFRKPKDVLCLVEKNLNTTENATVVVSGWYIEPVKFRFFMRKEEDMYREVDLSKLSLW